MILIKDRHGFPRHHYTFISNGKYDTYKGSTQVNQEARTLHTLFGKYDTYKGSTPSFYFLKRNTAETGKYDTYKGSTLE